MDCLLPASEGDGIFFRPICPKFVQCGFPTFHRGASATTARVTPAKTRYSVIIECCQLSPNHQMEAMRCQIFENILCNHFRCEINCVSITITFVLSDLRLHFVSVLQKNSVSIPVSLNEIIFPFQFQFPLTNITLQGGHIEHLM